MGIDLPKMLESMRAGYKAEVQQKGEVKANDVANRMARNLDATTASKLTSIFTQAAMTDGNMDLSEAEFEQIINNTEFQQIMQDSAKKQIDLINNATDPSMLHGPEDQPMTPRDQVVQEKGEFFANEVWDPMKHLADEALRFMEANNGQLENFTISGFPKGVKILYLGPSVSYIDDSNDTMTVVDGQPQVTRNADVAQALVVFEYQGEEYKLFSDHSTNNLQPWGNPSYIEE